MLFWCSLFKENTKNVQDFTITLNVPDDITYLTRIPVSECTYTESSKLYVKKNCKDKK